MAERFRDMKNKARRRNIFLNTISKGDNRETGRDI